MDTSGAGRGVLLASVRAAGQEVKHTVHELDARQYQVVYHPKLAVPHRIDLKYNGLHIAGNINVVFIFWSRYYQTHIFWIAISTNLH